MQWLQGLFQGPDANRDWQPPPPAPSKSPKKLFSASVLQEVHHNFGRLELKHESRKHIEKNAGNPYLPYNKDDALTFSYGKKGWNMRQSGICGFHHCFLSSPSVRRQSPPPPHIPLRLPKEVFEEKSSLEDGFGICPPLSSKYKNTGFHQIALPENPDGLSSFDIRKLLNESGYRETLTRGGTELPACTRTSSLEETPNMYIFLES